MRASAASAGGRSRPPPPPPPPPPGARTQPWARDTIINVWSTTKTMSFLCALILADRGEIDFYTPVARYWPEFKEGGKEGVEVRHLMAHTAGLPGWQEPMQPDDLYDW